MIFFTKPKCDSNFFNCTVWKLLTLRHSIQSPTSYYVTRKICRWAGVWWILGISHWQLREKTCVEDGQILRFGRFTLEESLLNPKLRGFEFEKCHPGQVQLHLVLQVRKDDTELEAISVLNPDHTNVVKFYEWFDYMGQTWLTLEMLDSNVMEWGWNPLPPKKIQPIRYCSTDLLLIDMENFNPNLLSQIKKLSLFVFLQLLVAVDALNTAHWHQTTQLYVCQQTGPALQSQTYRLWPSHSSLQSQARDGSPARGYRCLHHARLLN